MDIPFVGKPDRAFESASGERPTVLKSQDVRDQSRWVQVPRTAESSAPSWSVFRRFRFALLERNDFRRGVSLPCVTCSKLQCAFLQHRLIGNRVSAIDRFRLMTNHSHRSGSWHARAFEIAHRCTPKVVRDFAGQSCALSSSCPSLSKTPDRVPFLMEQPRDDLVGLFVPASRSFRVALPKTSRNSWISGKFRPSPCSAKLFGWRPMTSHCEVFCIR